MLRVFTASYHDYYVFSFKIQFIYHLIYFSLLRYNVSHHWLPWTLKSLPSSYPLLIQRMELEKHANLLHGLMAVHYSAKQNQLIQTMVCCLINFFNANINGIINIIVIVMRLQHHCKIPLSFILFLALISFFVAQW